MWYMAAKFPDQQTARSLWKQLHAQILNKNIDLTTTSLIYQDSWYVISITEVTPTADIQRIVRHYLSRGTITTLPPDITHALLQRRLERTIHADRRPGSDSLVYEGHKPTVIDYTTSNKTTPEQAAKHLRLVIDSLQQQGYPFISIYKIYVPYNTYSGTEDIEEYNERLDQADRYLFTDSARAMHKAVFEDDTTWISVVDNAWIEQDIVQPFSAFDMRLKAVYLYKVPDVTEQGIQDYDVYLVTIIDDLSRHRMSILYDAVEGTYQPALNYMCPYGICEVAEDRDGVSHRLNREACEQCKQECTIWLKWLHTAMRMIRRDYATTPTPVPFKQRIMRYQEKRLVPRHHGKGRDKEKMFTVEVRR